MEFDRKPRVLRLAYCKDATHYVFNVILALK